MSKTGRIFAVALSAVALLFSLGVGSASAVTILPFFLINGTNVGGSTVYQFWVDPSAIAGGTFGFDWGIAGTPSFQMTAFTPNPTAQVFQFSLNTTANTFNGNGGDTNNGNFVPLEIGTLTVNILPPRDPHLPDEDLTLFTGDYVASDFITVPATTPQVLAAIIPEPSTLVLLGFGMGGLAVLIRRSRS